ncbi:MAG: DUF1801 domain-containing protein [Pseudoxanthomonas sp.]
MALRVASALARLRLLRRLESTACNVIRGAVWCFLGSTYRWLRFRASSVSAGNYHAIEVPRMAAKRPETISEYIKAAPAVSQPHLRKLYAILKREAPDAQEAIKWGNPFFVEPRFLFAFSAHKAHLNFSPTPAALEQFKAELSGHKTTKHMLQLPYDQPLPEALIRDLARYCIKTVAERTDDGFW